MIAHFYCRYDTLNPGTIRREITAELSWKGLPWINKPIRDAALSRQFVEGKKKLPFVRDIFDLGCKGTEPEDILVYTSSDVHVRSDACAVISAALEEMDAVYAYRKNFLRIEGAITDEMYETGDLGAKSDLYAFRAAWWNQYRTQYPQMLIGMEAWDTIMRHLIDATNDPSKTCLKDIIAHEKHDSFWEKPENRYTLGSQKHNLRTASKWFVAHGHDPKWYGIVQV